MEMLHRKFADRLNIVIIQKIDTVTKNMAHVVLFSTDLSLSYEKIIDYYSLRFQIEFVFRDAKQYWGMEDLELPTWRKIDTWDVMWQSRNFFRLESLNGFQMAIR